MDLLTVLTQCSVPTDFTLVLALALTFSGGHPYTVKTVDELSYGSEELSLDEGESQRSVGRPLTREQALAKLTASSAMPGIQTGGDLIGLLPVPRAWAAIYEQSEEDLLEPCVNISIASAQLSEFEDDCARKRDPRRCALERYADAIGAPLFADDVSDTITRQALPRSAAAPVDVTTEAMLTSNVFLASQAKRMQRAWGADRLFVPAPQGETEPQKPSKQPSKGAK